MEVAVQIGLAAAQVLINLLNAYVQGANTSASLKIAVDAVAHWAPIIVGAFPQLEGQFENFVSILMGNDELTDDQLLQLTNTRLALETARKAANDAAAAAGEGQT